MLDDDSLARPVCKQYKLLEENGTLGMTEVMSNLNAALNAKGSMAPVLTTPPVGIYQSSSPCVRRCHTYHYRLVESKPNVYDDDLVGAKVKHFRSLLVPNFRKIFQQGNDIALYFSSMSLETWTTYRLKGPLDLVGEPILESFFAKVSQNYVSPQGL